ncbi:hypothetical protein QFZ79_000487 [Arthrobacter sp. V4I6]|nr:hypothetical protein [Arthrobacter sp. V4I6]MDQ0822748.1 hypothetical protein [Arthrobacter sp. V1I7]MDQ0852376.1 hypothetical protein [Arthrobacter sp. V4I6]
MAQRGGTDVPVEALWAAILGEAGRSCALRGTDEGKRLKDRQNDA